MMKRSEMNDDKELLSLTGHTNTKRAFLLLLEHSKKNWCHFDHGLLSGENAQASVVLTKGFGMTIAIHTLTWFVTANEFVCFVEIVSMSSKEKNESLLLSHLIASKVKCRMGKE